jgi:hypothetical protein
MSRMSLLILMRMALAIRGWPILSLLANRFWVLIRVRDWSPFWVLIRVRDWSPFWVLIRVRNWSPFWVLIRVRDWSRVWVLIDVAREHETY